MRIECTKAVDSSDDIDLTLKGIDIDTTVDETHGVYGHHEGTGKVFVAIQTGLDEGGGLIRNYIDTTGDEAHGVYGRHVGGGNIFLGGQNLHITTEGTESHGVAGYLADGLAPPEAGGLIHIGVSDSTIGTQGPEAFGIYGHHFGTGNIEIDVQNSDIVTQGNSSHGVFGKHHGIGDIRIDLTGTVTMPDLSSSLVPRGIYAVHCGFSSTDPSGCLRPALDTLSSGDILINVKSFEFIPLNSSAATSGYAINAVHLGGGDVRIDARNGTITMAGTARGVIQSLTRGTGDTYIYAEEVDIHTNGATTAGIYASAESQLGPQNIEITTKELDVTTRAIRSHGIWGSNETTGDVALDVQGGTLILHGERSHGVWSAVYYGSLSEIDVRNATIILEQGNTIGNGVRNIMAGTGDLDIDVRNNTTITIKDYGSHGIYGRHVSEGNAFSMSQGAPSIQKAQDSILQTRLPAPTASMLTIEAPEDLSI